MISETRMSARPSRSFPTVRSLDALLITRIARSRPFNATMRSAASAMIGTRSQATMFAAPARAAIIDNRPLPAPISRMRACRPSLATATWIARSKASFLVVSFNILACQKGTMIEIRRRN
jgi:hypothetical protein